MEHDLARWLAAASHYIFNPYSYLQLVRLLGNRSQVDSSYSFFPLVYDGLINNNKSGALTPTEARLAAAHDVMFIKGREGRTHCVSHSKTTFCSNSTDYKIQKHELFPDAFGSTCVSSLHLTLQQISGQSWFSSSGTDKVGQDCVHIHGHVIMNSQV